MSEPAKELRQAAIQIANGFQARRLELERQLEKVKLEVIEIEASLVAADVAVKRLANFRVNLGGDYQCPRCWITQGVNAPLVPQASSTEIDHFACRQCHSDYSFLRGGGG